MTGAAARPRFMSAEHVAAMNVLLEAAPEVQRLCAWLPRDYLVAYDLADGPGRVLWSVQIGRSSGVRFGLGPPPGAPDVTIKASYREMVAATRAARNGKASSAPMAVDGDAAVLQEVAPVLAAARAAAAVDVEFP